MLQAEMCRVENSIQKLTLAYPRCFVKIPKTRHYASSSLFSLYLILFDKLQFVVSSMFDIDLTRPSSSIKSRAGKESFHLALQFLHELGETHTQNNKGMVNVSLKSNLSVVKNWNNGAVQLQESSE